jgi:uncharacterized protein (DUF1015 family)
MAKDYPQHGVPMVEFLPFKGLIPKLSDAEEIGDRVSPPYDVIGDDEKVRLQSIDHNITRIILGAKDGKYDGAAKELAKWIKEGALVSTEEDCYYLYRQSFVSHGRNLTRTGIMGRLRLESYDEGNILPHEETFPKVKEDRLNLLRATSSHLESIFGTFDGVDKELAESLKGSVALFEFIDPAGVSHSFRIIKKKKAVDQLRSILTTKKVLIADGHHRYETALKYSLENPEDQEKRYVLTTLVASDDPGLVVEPTHRLLRSNGIPSEQFMNATAKDFGIWEMRSMEDLGLAMSRSKRVMIGILLEGGKIFALDHLQPPNKDPMWSIDAYVCEELVIKPIQSSMPADNQMKVEYDHDLESVKAKMKTGEYDMAVILSPPKLETIWALARSGRKMPKKSTYFYPKIWSGFVIYAMG